MKKEDNIILMMMGVPASGKTTLANFIKDNVDNVVVLSSDDIRQELYDDESCQDNPKVIFKLLYKRVAKELKNKRKFIIIDSCATKKIDREPVFKKFKNKSRIIGIMMNTEINDCMVRNSKRDRTVPCYAILRMYKKFEMPNLEEGFEKIISSCENYNLMLNEIKVL